MRFHVISIFPQMIEDYFRQGILSRALEQGLIDLNVIDLKPYAGNSYNKVDKPIYGYGKGMLYQAQALKDALADISSNERRPKVLYLSPGGKVLDNKMARQLAREEDLVLIAARYEGIDQRFIDLYVDEEVSIGDYVLTGGELPALVLIDAVSRFIPGSIKQESAEDESFENGLLEYAHYTEPVEWEGMKVPEVLRSGDHKKVEEYRRYSSLRKTYFQRTELLWAFQPEWNMPQTQNEVKILKSKNTQRKQFLTMIQKMAKEWKHGRRNGQKHG